MDELEISFMFDLLCCSGWFGYATAPKKRETLDYIASSSLLPADTFHVKNEIVSFRIL